MKSHLLCLIICIMFFKFSFSQDWEWVNKFYSHAKAAQNPVVTTCIDGNGDSLVVVGGFFKDSVYYQTNAQYLVNDGGEYSGFIAILNDKGQLKWWKKWVGPEVYVSSCKWYSNEIYVYGYFLDSMKVENTWFKTLISSGSGGGSTKGIFLLKYDRNGNYLNGSVIASSFSMHAEDLVVSNDGIYCSYSFDDIVYYTDDTILTSSSTIGIEKLDLGNFASLWRTYGINYASTFPDEIAHLYVDKNSVYVSGLYGSFGTPGAPFIMSSFSISGTNNFLAKLNRTNGTPQFLKNIGFGQVKVKDMLVKKDAVYITGNVSTKTVFGNDTIVPRFSNQDFLVLCDTVDGVVKKVYTSSVGNISSGSTLSKDASDNLYYSIQFRDTLVWRNDTICHPVLSSSFQSGHFKLTNDTLLRYGHSVATSPNREFYWTKSYIDNIGNWYLVGTTVGDLYFDTAQIIQPNGGNNINSVVAKISCKRPSPTIFCLDTTLCWNESTILSTIPKEYENYQWIPPSSNSYTNFVIQGGDYSLYLMDENGCHSDTSHIFIRQYLQQHFQLQQICDSIFTTTTNATNIQWSFNNQGVASNLSYTQFNGNGWYVISGYDEHECLMKDSIYASITPVTFTLQLNCQELKTNSSNDVIWYWNHIPVDTSKIFIVPSSGIYYAIYEDTVHCVWSSDTLNIEANRIASSNTFSVYPVPVVDVDNKLYFKLNNDVYPTKIQIIDLQGRNFSLPSKCRKIGEEINECETQSIYQIVLPELSPGMYQVMIEWDNVILQQKIIIQK